VERKQARQRLNGNHERIYGATYDLPLEQAKHCIGFITRFAMVTASRSSPVGRQQEPPLGALLRADGEREKSSQYGRS